MYLLIETKNNAEFTVVVGDKDYFFVKTVRKAYQQAELLLSTIDYLLAKNNIELKQLKAIFVVSGPGAFSSLRIGVATANSLAYSLNVPVIGIKDLKVWQNLESDELILKYWQNALSKLKNQKKFDMKKVVKPFYDKEPNIT